MEYRRRAECPIIFLAPKQVSAIFHLCCHSQGQQTTMSPRKYVLTCLFGNTASWFRLNRRLPRPARVAVVRNDSEAQAPRTCTTYTRENIVAEWIGYFLPTVWGNWGLWGWLHQRGTFRITHLLMPAGSFLSSFSLSLFLLSLSE